MKKQQSAGGIVVRNIRGAWEVLVLQDMNDTWTFPKGNINTGEKPEHAAQREIQEEVGLTDLALHETLTDISYVYRRNGLIRKTVTYFLFESKGDQHPVNQTEEGIHNATWTPIDRAIEIIGYPKTNKPLLDTVKQWTLHRHRT